MSARTHHGAAALSRTGGSGQQPVLLATLVLTAVVLAVDLHTELGVAGGVPYGAVVLLTTWLHGRASTYAAAISCSLLTVVGFFASPLGGELWKVLFNRGLALFVIWSAAVVVLLRKRDEARRAALEARLLQTQKLESLGLLAGGVAHDFNNLLMPIIGHADMLLGNAQLDPRVAPGLRAIQAAANQAARITARLLAFTGRGRPEMRPSNLNKLVMAARPLFEKSIARNVSLRFSLDPELPPVDVDWGGIQQVVMNIVVNAAQASEAGGGEIHIRTTVKPFGRSQLADAHGDCAPASGTYVVLEVEDGGCGMDTETKARLFDPFFTTKDLGHGLGMSAVLGILRAHGAALLVDSAPGRGTHIAVVFPPSERQLQVAASRPVKHARAFRSILVVDDQPLVRTTACSMLEQAGYTVYTAVDGLDALEQCRAHVDELDGVLLDVNMPHMGGEESFRALRALAPDVKVLFCSGQSLPVAARGLCELPGVGFLAKPYTSDDLTSALEALLGGPHVAPQPTASANTHAD